jgi:hypothetical protein
LLANASDTLHLTTEERELVDSPTIIPTLLPLSDAQMETARQMIDRHADVLSAVAKACNAPHFVCPTDPDDLVGSADLKNLGRFRALAKFIRMVLLFHHQSGRDDLVNEELCEIERIALITADGHYLIHGLVGMAINGVEAKVVLDLAPDLEVKSASVVQGFPRPALSQLIQRLADSQFFLEYFRHTLEGERLYCVATAKAMDRQTVLFRPIFTLDSLRENDNYDTMLSALEAAPDAFSDFHYTPPSVTGSESNLWRCTHLLSSESLDFHRFGKLYYKYISDRLAAALRLAIRLYQVEHGGTYPPNLEALRPRYIDALPADPFSPNHRPFIYVPTRAIFYSVGENGTDDVGTVATGKVLPDWYHSLDAVYPLERPLVVPPATPPTASSP